MSLGELFRDWREVVCCKSRIRQLRQKCAAEKPVVEKVEKFGEQC